MISLTQRDTEALEDLLLRMSTENMMEDLMLMYSAYVEHAMDPDIYQLDAQMAIDLQNKLFTVQTALQIVMTVDRANLELQKAS